MSFVVPCFDAGGVRVFRLDADAARRRLRELAGRLLQARPDVTRVLLFGSLARGDAHPGSDADILVMLDCSAVPILERLSSLQAHFDGAGIGCDLLAYTEAELEALRREGRGFVVDAAGEGLTADRCGARKIGSCRGTRQAPARRTRVALAASGAAAFGRPRR